MEILYPKRRLDVKSTLLPDGCLVIFDEKTEWAHTVSPIGAIAWELSDGSRTINDIAQEIVQLTAADLNEESLAGELQTLISELSDTGLLI